MTVQITGLSSMATRHVLANLAGSYGHRTGRGVAIRSMGGVEAAQLIRSGAPTDLVVLASKVMEQLEAEGYLVPGSRAAFARSGIAVAVRAGASRPPISDSESVKQAILQSGRICYSTGPSGDHLKQLWEDWGIAELLRRRAIQAPPGVPVGEMVAQGEAELGFQQLSELMHLPGIDIIGPLPDEIQAMTVFAAGIGSASWQVDEARALLADLTSPGAASVKREHGMEPG
jgi:molybdate transport system substrate-binding protein